MKMPLSYDQHCESSPVAATGRGYADVMALVTSAGPWSPAAFAGVDIAAKFNAHLTGCYIDPSLRSLRGIDDEPTVMALLMDARRLERDDYDAFAAFAHAGGVKHVSWQRTQVAPAKTMRALGAWQDLIILERDLAEEASMLEVLGEALLTCRAPCLVLPPGWDKPLAFTRIVVGWNGGIESIRAVHAALPLAAAADQVIVLKDGALALEKEDRQPPFDPTIYLRSHGVSVSEIPLYASPLNSGPELMRTARRLSADCLVMGAYGHARVRERVLGGATRHILQHAEIPVLMQH